MERLVNVGAVIGISFLLASVGLAQEPSPTPAVAEMERVIVTGSNIPTSEEVGPNPVDTYRRDDITRLGVRTPSDLIQRIPAATGVGITENNTNGGDGTTRIDLRGIDPKETLVLEDGRRLANVGFAGSSVDFNMFPLGLIDHIDILKDGASPVYGSDAVTGVVNVYLIHRFRGLELYASYGNTNTGFANDMGQEIAYLLAGTGDDKTDIVVYAGFFNEAAIYSRDVNISHDSDFRPFGGSDARSGNYAGRVQGFVFQPNLAGGSLTPTPHAFANAQSNPEYVPVGSLPREQRGFNFGDTTPEIAPTDREYFYGAFTRDLCDKYLTIFADFKYVRQFWDGGEAAAPFTDVWSDALHPFGISFSGISVPIQNAFNPFNVANYTSAGGFNPQFPQTQISAAPSGTAFTTGVRYRSLETGLRTDKVTTDNYLFTGGLKGNLGEFGDYFKTWDWETGFRYNEDYRVERFGGIVNNNALRRALLDTNPATAFNPFGLNQNSQTVKDEIFVTTNHVGWTQLETEDLRLTGDLFNVPAGPVSFAIGEDHRTEHTTDNPDALTASGQTIGASNFAPTKGSRDVWSTFWEVRVPVTSPSWNCPGFYSLELDYAERFDGFSDFGSTERPKFSVRWQPIDSALTLRASYIEAFHAPSLSDLFAGASQDFPNIHDPLSTATPPQVEADTPGNPNLQPEIAYEYTYGGVVTPGKWWSALQGLTISVDYGHLDIRGFQSFLDPQFIVDHESEFPGLVVRDPTQGNAIIFILSPEQNLGRFIESYFDYELVETFETSRLGHGDLGTLTATFNGTYVADIRVQVFPGTKTFHAAGKFGGGFQGPSSGGNFTHNRCYTSLFYDGPQGSWLGGLDTGFTVHFTGQYWDTYGFGFFNNKPRDPSNPDSRPIGFTDRKIREWTTLDWIMNYTFNFATPAPGKEVPGYAKDGGLSGKDKNVIPVSTAAYNPCGWRAWLDKTTVTLGIDNVTDEQPPFVAAAFENGFDEVTANARGRFWYAALKKRF